MKILLATAISLLIASPIFSQAIPISGSSHISNERIPPLDGNFTALMMAINDPSPKTLQVLINKAKENTAYKPGSDHFLEYFAGIVSFCVLQSPDGDFPRAIVQTYNEIISRSFKEGERPSPEAVSAWGYEISQFILASGGRYNPDDQRFLKLLRMSVTCILYKKHGIRDMAVFETFLAGMDKGFSN